MSIWAAGFAASAYPSLRPRAAVELVMRDAKVLA